MSVALVTVNSQDYARGRATGWVYLTVIPAVLILMTFAYRIIRLSFCADATGLVIRNILSTRRVPLAEITGFDIGTRSPFSGNAIRVITQSGSIPVDVYRTHFRGGLALNRLCDVADELDDWLAGARALDAP